MNTHALTLENTPSLSATTDDLPQLFQESKTQKIISKQPDKKQFMVD